LLKLSDKFAFKFFSSENRLKKLARV
jgi:hypothetical protein